MTRPTGCRAVVNVQVLLIATFVSLLGLLSTAQTPQQPTAKSAKGARPGGPPADKPQRPNILEGTEADDTLTAGHGDTLLLGGEGHDTLRGGPGNDTLDGAAGDDRLMGGPGDDLLDGGAGLDILLGGEGDDFIDGSDEEDTLDGGPGNDDMDGGDADDILRGGAGEDVMVGGDGNDVLAGGEGADRLAGRDNNDTLSGGPGDDFAEGGDGDDTVDGDDGADILDAGDGDDVARGGPGADLLKGGSGRDALSGGPDDDTLLGSSGDDLLNGDDGNDTLFGGDGQDVLNGGQGYDWLLGGLGGDTVRGGPEDDLIVVRAGDVDADGNELIDGGSGDDTLVFNGFGYADLPVLSPGGPGNGMFSDPITGGTYYFGGIERSQHAHLFTHLVPGEDRASTFVFVNPSATAASSGRIAFFRENGEPLPLSVMNADPQPNFSLMVPPLGRVSFEASQPAASLEGAAQVLADRPLSGVARTSATGAGVGEANLVDNFIVPVLEDQTAGVRTGVIIFNGTVTSRIKLTLHDPSGEELSTESLGGVEIEIPPYGRRVFLVREVFRELLDQLPNGATFQGTMTVEGGIDRPQDGGSLAATGFRQAPDAKFTPFPVTPVGPLPANRTHYFAAVASGSASFSSIVLVNPSPTDRAIGTLAFFGESGQPWSVGIDEIPTAATVPFDIGPLGSATFTTAADGPVQVGSARAQTSEGVVGAIVHLRSSAGGVVVAGPSGLFQSFVAPVQRTLTAGINTEVALHSPERALSLSLVLRNGDGSDLDGASAILRLPANGGTRTTLTELFPNAAMDEFQGTLTVTADGGSVAALVTETGGSAGRVVMPVAPLLP